MTWLSEVFSDISTREAASIEDVSYLVLAQAKAQDHEFSPYNIINSLRYSPPPLRPVRQHGDVEAIEKVLAEAVVWLESEGLIVAFTDPNGNWYAVSRRGRAIQSPKDLSSYAKRAYLPKEVLRDDIAEVALSPFLCCSAPRLWNTQFGLRGLALSGLMIHSLELGRRPLSERAV